MIRFFFDYTTEDRALYDYRGEEFKSPDGALDFAEAIVLDLKHSLRADWTGWSVEVRDVEGKKIFSLPIGSSELKAA
jgi:hypothetical protein